MRQETYRIKCPRHILFGDPLYFEKYASQPEQMEKLVVDYKPPRTFKAGVSLVETEHPEYPEYMVRTMTIYLAPEQHLRVYMDGMIYKPQRTDCKEIGVDTACYMVGVDGRCLDIRTGADGYWGERREYYRESDGKRHVDAVIISIDLPDYETFGEMQRMAKYFFEDLKPVEKQKKPDKGKGQDR